MLLVPAQRYYTFIELAITYTNDIYWIKCRSLSFWLRFSLVRHGHPHLWAWSFIPPERLGRSVWLRADCPEPSNPSPGGFSLECVSWSPFQSVAGSQSV